MNLRGTGTSTVASGFSEPRTELAPGYAADFPGHVRKSFKPRSRKVNLSTQYVKMTQSTVNIWFVVQ